MRRVYAATLLSGMVLLGGCSSSDDEVTSSSVEVTELGIKGMGSVDTVLEAAYTLNDSSGLEPSVSSIQWLVSDSSDGNYEAISGESLNPKSCNPSSGRPNTGIDQIFQTPVMLLSSKYWPFQWIFID